MLDGFLIEGSNHVETTLTIDTAASVSSLKVVHCTIDNTTLDGDVDIDLCIIGDISYLNGHIHDSGLKGTITLGGGKEAVLESCYTIDQDNPAIIDMGGSGNDLAMPNYSGIVYIRNLSSPTEEIGVGLNAGMVVLEDTITAGNITIAGTGAVINNSSVIPNTTALVSQTTLAEAVWSYERP